MHQSMLATESPEQRNVGEARRLAHQLAQSRWPGVELSLQQFGDHLERHGWAQQLPRTTDELYLCCACGLGNVEACRRLDLEYFPALEASLARQCRRRDFIEEILQQTRERLFVGPTRRIGSYKGKGSLLGWLQRVARRLASDLFRRERKDRRLSAPGGRYAAETAHAELPDRADGSGPAHPSCLGQLERALLTAMQQLTPDDRQLLYLHYVRGLSADEIGQCIQRDRSNVYRRLIQIRDRIKRRSITSAREQTGIGDRDELAVLFQANCMGIYLDPIIWLDPGRSAEGEEGPGGGE